MRANWRVFLVASVVLSGLAVAEVASGQQIPSSPYWKNEIVFPDDPFRASGMSESDPGWVKFTILLDPYDPNVVYFQDCTQYKFHYDFARQHLTPFLGMTPQQFDQATLYEQGQQAILGAVILPPVQGWPPPPAYPEYGIQFVRRDSYTRDQILSLFNLVKSKVQAEPGITAYYFPAYEQIATAQANRQWFESQGILISSADRWAEGNIGYSSGWALGRLKYFDADDIQGAYLAGLLEPNDILLTNGVPAEIPFVAGVITLAPSTPNSHVAILAQTFGVPFVYLAIPADAEHAQALVGHRIILRAHYTYLDWNIRLIDVEGVLDEQSSAEILALKSPPHLDISPVTPYGAYSASTDGLMPSDIRYFGGKAANYGMLRRTIPDNAPVSVAFSFNLWNEFLAQTLLSGRTLRQEIDNRLSQYTYPPSNMAALASDLYDIRRMFTNDLVTRFTQAQTDAVIAILQDPNYGFDPDSNIRFRSSTNTEDSNHFTGAGLYESFSGCLADDLDGDNVGPCRCDPDRSQERGVFRAIRRVFASFYNDNAYLERLRHDVNEHEVGMALLVHHSFPDEIELANGVATVQKHSGSSRQMTLVTQKGAVSVANPVDGSIPEEVRVGYYTYSVIATLIRSSNLVQLGATVMTWQDDYINLAHLLAAAADEFEQVTGKTHNYTLDFEYKKVAPDGELVVKQVREIPHPDNTPSITPFLIKEPVEYCTFQGEYGDVFANHRLKSRWLLSTQNLWLTKKNLADCFYNQLSLEYMDADRIRRLSGMLQLWPFASHRVEQAPNPDQMNTMDGWLMHHLSNPRTCELRTEWIPTQVSPSQNPMLTLIDFYWPTFHVEYEQPVPSWDWQGPIATTYESIQLCPCPVEQEGDIFKERFFGGPNDVWLGPGDVNITTRFYWPPTPKGPIAGYTAPAVRGVETVIEGCTSEPIVLHNWYSQTYRPLHHNFGEHFIFEPRLDKQVPSEILAELQTKNIRLIHVYPDPEPPSRGYVMEPHGFDEKPFLAGDIDGDKDVDFEDVALLVGRWLDAVCDTCGGADLTGDGQVRLDDFGQLGRDWQQSIK